MKHIYKNLMIWVVSLFGMSLTAQTVADKYKAMLPQSGKQQWEKTVKAMPNPQMPVTRILHDRMSQSVISRSASLRATTAQAMQLDSIIDCSPKGEKQSKYVYQYNAQGKITEELEYSWNDQGWIPNSRYLYEYDANGNCLSNVYYKLNGSDWRLFSKEVSTYDSANHLTSISENYYNIAEEITSQYYTEYNSKGAQTKYEYKELRDGVLTLTLQDQYNYDSANRQTHAESKFLDENGEWNFTLYVDYEYNSQGRRTLYENYSWNADEGKLFLIQGYYTQYDDMGRNIYNEQKDWNGSGYERVVFRVDYDENNKIILKEDLRDNPDMYRHSIEEYTYVDGLSSTSNLKDTLIWKDDGSKEVSYTSTDYKYNDKGRLLLEETFDVDPETEQRGTKISSLEMTYDSLSRITAMISSFYENNSISDRDKTEYEYIDDNGNYIESYYNWDNESKDWILSYKTKREYVQTGVESYYYQDSSWDEESGKWIISVGYKFEYEGDSNNYTQMEYSWSKDAGDWVINYGYKSVDETSGENYCKVTAKYDVDNTCWVVVESNKREVTDGNPKIIKQYSLPKNDLENWQLDGISYYYYSESSVANESIDAVDARIYTRPGTIHVDMEGKAALSVYAANGACCYQSSISGSTDVSNLQRGIYFVVLQSDSGTKKVKVLVK